VYAVDDIENQPHCNAKFFKIKISIYCKHFTKVTVPLSISATSQMASSWALSSCEFSRTLLAWKPLRYPLIGFKAVNISQYFRCSSSVILCCCAEDILPVQLSSCRHDQGPEYRDLVMPHNSGGGALIYPTVR
jgi:hypothetical protein